MPGSFRAFLFSEITDNPLKNNESRRDARSRVSILKTRRGFRMNPTGIKPKIAIRGGISNDDFGIMPRKRGETSNRSSQRREISRLYCKSLLLSMLLS